jgi:DNA-binding transcriptional MerR regulator
MRIMDELSAKELADRSGVTAEQLRRLVELGIIIPTSEGRYRRSDTQRIRVVDTLAEAGFGPEQLSELIATGAYDLDWASVVFPEPTAQLTTTLEEAAAATGLPEDLAARLFDAWELPRPQSDQGLRADDDELLQLAVPALEGFGRDEAALLGAARQLGDRLRGLAESQVRLFHTHVEHQLAAEGHPDHSWSDDLNHIAASMMASLERTLVLLYRRHFEHYVLGGDRAPGRGGPRAGRTGPTPLGPTPGDRLSRPHRLHQAHRGARRPGRGRAGRPAGRDRP